MTSGCGLNVTCDGQLWRWRLATTSCPTSTGVCAAPDTPIATPEGERRIDQIHAGDLVYSVDHEAIRAVAVVRVTRTLVYDHRVLRIRMASGRTLEMSPGHPTADGRHFADLVAGSLLDGQSVASIDLVPYDAPATYDILPASDSESYFAAGLQVGSTLASSSRSCGAQ